MYSVQIETSDGTLSRINLGIEYFAKEDITVYRNDSQVPLVLGTDWGWDGTKTIVLLKGPEPAGNSILIRRNTDKDRAFNIYDGGAPFSRESLDENFRQMIYLAQEFTEGNGLDGIYRPLNMHGYRIINLGNPTDPTDAANKQYVDAVDSKHTAWNQKQDNDIAALQIGIVDGVSSRTVPWVYTATGGEDTLSPPYRFSSALVYLNGVMQYELSGAFTIVNNVVMLAEPLLQGDEVLVLVGSRPAAPMDDLILASPDGKHWRVLVDNTGNITTEVV